MAFFFQFLCFFCFFKTYFQSVLRIGFGSGSKKDYALGSGLRKDYDLDLADPIRDSRDRIPIRLLT